MICAIVCKMSLIQVSPGDGVRINAGKGSNLISGPQVGPKEHSFPFTLLFVMDLYVEKFRYFAFSDH